MKIIHERADLQIAEALVFGESRRVVHYPQIGGRLQVGQRVVLNTTATHLQLGTGGYDFVLYAEGSVDFDPEELGHIMKLRYTPYQLKVLSVEEEASPYHEVIKNADSLLGMPVIIAPLHSMLSPIVAVIKTMAPALKIAYLMSDGGALPLAFSQTISDLRARDWLEGTITFGHAFGGDYEAVNVYTALLAAKSVVQADIAIITMGPGIVGTHTPYGFTGVEQANFLHAVKILQGEPLAVLRISFADPRERHQGISHHSQTVFGKLTFVRSKLALPILDQIKDNLLTRQLLASGIRKKHELVYLPTVQVEKIFKEKDLHLRTMGRDFLADREFFLTAGLSGLLATKNLSER